MRKPALFIFLLSLFLISLNSFISHADPLDNWHWRSPLPQGNTLRAVTYGNGLYVAVGSAGSIVTSHNGIDLTLRDSGTTADITEVAYGNGQFVAITGETVLISPDGILWTIQVLDGPFFSGITYGNGLFVAIGLDTAANPSVECAIYSSDDGLHWIKRSSPLYGLNDVTYGNGVFVAVGGRRISSSTDGIFWNESSLFEIFLDSVAYGNGVFVAVSGTTVATSPDGNTWTIRTVSLDSGPYPRLLYVAFGNGTFVGVVEGYGRVSHVYDVYTSTDGAGWTKTSAKFAHRPYGITFGGGHFVAVGLWGDAYSSVDGMNWTQRTSETSTHLNAIAYGNHKFVAVGSRGNSYEGSEGVIFTSVDGVNWTTQDLRHDVSFWGIAYGNGIFVIVGSRYTYSGIDNVHYDDIILTSNDGLDWSEHILYNTTKYSSLSSITYGNGMFVTVGYGTIVTSVDGVTWISSGASDSLYAVTYGNGIFAATGRDSVIATSTDGMTWSYGLLDPSPSVAYDGIAYGNGMFVIVGGSSCLMMEWCDYPIIRTSSDTKTWAEVIPATSLLGIVYEKGIFVAVGGEITTSQDGINWKRSSANLSSWLRGVAFGNNTFVSVGLGSTILQSDPLSGNCTATLSSSTKLSMPIIGFHEGYLSADLEYVPDAAGTHMFKVTRVEMLSNTDEWSECQPATLTTEEDNLKLQVPAVKFDNLYYSADFEYVPSTDNQTWFKLTGSERL